MQLLPKILEAGEYACYRLINQISASGEILTVFNLNVVSLSVFGFFRFRWSNQITRRKLLQIVKHFKSLSEFEVLQRYRSIENTLIRKGFNFPTFHVSGEMFAYSDN